MSRGIRFLLFAPLVMAVLTPSLATGQGEDSQCAPTIVLVSRGSGESPNPGFGQPGDAFVKQLRRADRFGPTVAAIPNPYPAVGLNWKIPAQAANLVGAATKVPGFGAYHASIVQGKAFVRSQLLTLSQSCPGSRLFLAGYSAGAQVSADVYQALDPVTRSHVAGVVLFGDPYFRGTSADGQSTYSSRRHGALGQRPEFPPDTHGRVLSYCHGGDLVCQGLPGLTGSRHKYATPEPALAAQYFAEAIPDPTIGFGGAAKPVLATASAAESRALLRDGLRSKACQYAKLHPNPNPPGHCILSAPRLSRLDRHFGDVRDHGLDGHAGVVLFRPRGDIAAFAPVFDYGGGLSECGRDGDLRLRRGMRSLGSCISYQPCLEFAPCVPSSSGDPDGMIRRPTGFELVDNAGTSRALLYAVRWNDDSSGQGTLFVNGRQRLAQFNLGGITQQCGQFVWDTIAIPAAPDLRLRHNLCP